VNRKHAGLAAATVLIAGGTGAGLALAAGVPGVPGGHAQEGMIGTIIVRPAG
jgi:hypothetical protein